MSQRRGVGEAHGAAVLLLACCCMIVVMLIVIVTMSMSWFVSLKTDTLGCSLVSLGFYFLFLARPKILSI